MGMTEPRPQPGPAAFTFTPANPYAWQTVAFTDTCTGGPTSWAWDFGDGSTATARNPMHIFANGGTYIVSLTAGGNTVSSVVNVQYPLQPRSRFMRRAIAIANKYPRVI
jgi:PKD repeat protein